jgi:hypothetical protein
VIRSTCKTPFRLKYASAPACRSNLAITGYEVILRRAASPVGRGGGEERKQRFLKKARKKFLFTGVVAAVVASMRRGWPLRGHEGVSLSRSIVELLLLSPAGETTADPESKKFFASFFSKKKRFLA